MIKSCFSYFGGKSRVAPTIWKAFGSVTNYIEPFCGSLAVLLANPNPCKIETVNDKDCFLCVAPETQILMQDLTWQNAGNLHIGSKLLAFDEENPGIKKEEFGAPSQYRKWRKSEVLDIQKTIQPCYKLCFSDGTVIVASENHSWLVGSHCTGKGGRGWRWVQTKNLISNRKNQFSWVLKLVSLSKKEDSYDAGWLAGFADGEGNIKKSSGSTISISQNPGPSADKLNLLLLKYNFNFSISKKRKCWKFEIKGGIKEQLRFLMSIRPERLINNFINKIENVSIYGRKHSAVSLISKEFIGNKEVIAISTSTKTYVAEGLASHNCNFWRAVSNDCDNVIKYADYPVNETDLHARLKWLLSSATDDFKLKMDSDPDFYDSKIAGWWLWGMGASIAGNWMLPKGIKSMPQISSAGGGIHGLTHSVDDWLKKIKDRTRRVRVCCGDWSKIVVPSVSYNNKGLSDKDITAVFLDPPYDISNRTKVYKEESNIFKDVCKWAINNGDNPRLRIAVCGYDGNYGFPDTWFKYQWKANGGMANVKGENSRGKSNKSLETIWFSPHCLKINI